MPPFYMAGYLPILIQLVLGIGLAIIIVTLSYLIGKHRRSAVKGQPYECGITPVGDAEHRFSVKYYLVAIVFILFDIEAVFLIPWAVEMRQLKLFGFFEMLVYMAIVLAGFYYIWTKGVIDWNTPERSEE
ncbi:MAG TPA: NADH-quinone oxidoreductase subunit A [Terriglobales bacterium]|nr:NADH-quinone oxidoreductase subunit A [Terriglobales bacterium]